jgi:hypothetical protein
MRSRMNHETGSRMMRVVQFEILATFEMATSLQAEIQGLVRYARFSDT